MKRVTGIKTVSLAAIGTLGATLAHLLGGWDTALQTLIIFMAIDYLTGLTVAGVFHKSENSACGALESRAGWRGLCRKGVTLAIVLVAAQLDKMAGTDIIRNGVIIAYVANETISIIENAGLMGIPVPDVLSRAIDALQKKR